MPKYVDPTGIYDPQVYNPDFWAGLYNDDAPNPEANRVLGTAFTKEDIKAMGLPDWVTPNDIRFGRKDKNSYVSSDYLDVYKHGEKGTWTRVQFQIQADKSLKAVAREFGRDSSMTEDFAKVAPVFLAPALPAIGAGVGGALGLTGTAATIAGGAVTGGAMAGLTGGDILKGAIFGGLGGATGGLAGKIAQASGLGTGVSNLLAKLVVGAGKSAIGGGKFDPTGALLSMIPGVTGTAADKVLNPVLTTALRKQIKV